MGSARFSTRFKEELGSAAAVALIGAAAFVIAGGYPVESQLFPRLVATVMFVCAAGIAIRAWRCERGGGEWLQQGTSVFGGLRFGWAQLVSLVAVVAYVFSIRYIGYITATLIFIPLASIAVGARDWRWIVLGTLAFSAFTWILAIRVFHIPLPPDVLLGLFGVR